MLLLISRNEIVVRKDCDTNPDIRTIFLSTEPTNDDKFKAVRIKIGTIEVVVPGAALLTAVENCIR
jgi:hypothetical protein